MSTLDEFLKEVEIQADVTILEKSVWRNVKRLLEIIRVQREATEYSSCGHMDDADFHDKDQFELAEAIISIANKSRAAQAKVQEIVNDAR